jgi:hypothetical protein
MLVARSGHVATAVDDIRRATANPGCGVTAPEVDRQLH